MIPSSRVILFLLLLAIIACCVSVSNSGKDEEEKIDVTKFFRKPTAQKEVSSMVKDELMHKVYTYAYQTNQVIEADDDDDDEEIVEAKQEGVQTTDSGTEAATATNTDDSVVVEDASTAAQAVEEMKNELKKLGFDEIGPEDQELLQEFAEKTPEELKTSVSQIADEVYSLLSSSPEINSDTVQIKVIKKEILSPSAKSLQSKLKAAKRQLFGTEKIEKNPERAFEMFRNISMEYPDDSISLHMMGLIQKKSEFGMFNFTGYKHSMLQAALRGNSLAQFEVGFLVSNGYVTQKDIDTVYPLENAPVVNLTAVDVEALAVSNYFFSSLNNNMYGQLALGYRHLIGAGVPKDCTAASYYYKAVADNMIMSMSVSGSMNSDHVRLSDDMAIQQKQSQSEIMDYYKYTADKGVPAAQLVVGFAHLYGARGLEQNGELARDYLERAAEAGEAEAYGPLGNMYAKGLGGIIPDNDTALEYYKKGAALGDSASMNGLGYMYLNGNGVKKDAKIAAHYFNMSASHGNAEGQYNLGLLYISGMGVLINYKAAFELMTRSAAQGQNLAHYQLGVMHLKGMGTEPNCNVAVKFLKHFIERGSWTFVLERAYEDYVAGNYAEALLTYEQVADLGIEIGQSNAAFMYYHGLGTAELLEDVMEENPQFELKFLENRKSLKYYKQAAEQGNVDAAVKVGDFYYYGQGSAIKFDKSVQHYRKAADMRNPQATFNLGYMHENGIGLPQDFHLAKRYYDMSVEADPNAYIPVLLALAKLYARWGYALAQDYLHGTSTVEEAQTITREPLTLTYAGVKAWVNANEDKLLAALVGLLSVLFLVRQILAAIRPPRVQQPLVQPAQEVQQEQEPEQGVQQQEQREEQNEQGIHRRHFHAQEQQNGDM